MAGDTTSTSNLTAREVEILCAMCKAMKSKPEVRLASRPTIADPLITSSIQVDMQLFATLAGFSTPASATTNLAKVLKKAKAVGPASSEASKTGSARKRKAGMLLSRSMTIPLVCLR